ncbi:MAG: divergent polysaccharide deacetylase family protein [Rhodobacteraceae bacterium]|nr:divergent polysaccharide deacetylase family protein [Paracoccaceae bacterium]
MAGGFGAGFLKGAAISLVFAGSLSLLMPLPPRDPGQSSQVDLTTPEGSGFNVERPDSNPVLPGEDRAVIGDTTPLPEIDDSGVATPSPDTSSAAQPDAQAGVSMPAPAPAEDDVAMISASDDAENLPAQPPALGVPMAEIGNPVVDIPVNRLPVVEPPATEIATPEVDDTGDVTRTEVPPVAASIGGAALERNKVGFSNPDGKPLLSVILIDAGDEGLDKEVLLTFSFPVTFALDPTRPGATADAKRLSRGGFEILALAPGGEAALVATGNPADVAAALGGVFAAIPEAVGLIDRPDATLQAAPDLAGDVIAALGSTGHGLITYDIGLNGTDKSARRDGVASGVVYRVLDRERESGAVIQRYLDRAALEAGKDGHVIVMGRTYPETVTALFSWAVGGKNAGIALAPVSASLLAQ